MNRYKSTYKLPHKNCLTPSLRRRMGTWSLDEFKVTRWILSCGSCWLREETIVALGISLVTQKGNDRRSSALRGGSERKRSSL
ncbi:hypothetical protein J6590_018525 [Homalodisca vitripennis]|nr:hypothetical protein J6590_018525 [Homalodisca vitripennis]